MKKYLAALFLVLSIAHASAQPPPVPALPDTTRVTSYSITGTTCACSVGFAIYGDSTDVDEWIQVYVGGTAFPSTDPTYGWSLSSATGPLATIPRPITNAVLTFNSVHTATVAIVGSVRPRRTAQFAENRGVAARDLNQWLTYIVAGMRELWDKANRSIVGQPGDVLTPLPPAATRGNSNSGTLLGFGGDGQPKLYPNGTQVNWGTGVVLGITRSQISSNIITNVTFLVSGYLAAGDYGALAPYTSVGASPSGPMAIQDAAGTWFNLLINGGAANVDWFISGGAGTQASPYTGWDTNITWTAGYTYRFGAHFYGFSSLSISVPVTLIGSGGSSLNSDVFGGTWLNSLNFGTVLLATATSGNAITLNQASNSYAYNLRDMMIVGPGSGTSVGVAMGTVARASVQSRWSNVYVANFSQCLEFDNVEDGTFDHIRMNGCTTGLIAGLNTNQNVFLDLQVQHATTGITFSNNSQNVIVGGLIQNVTTGFTFIGANSLSIKGVYGEAFTTFFNFNGTVSGSTSVDISDVYASGTNLIGSSGVITQSYVTIKNVQWGGALLTIPSNFRNAYLESIQVTAITDNGANTIICDGDQGCKFPSVATGIIKHSKPEIDTSYFYDNPGGGTSTMGAGVGRFIINPGGGVATLTIVLPPNPVDGQLFGIASSQAITTLTTSTSDSTSLVAPPTTLAAKGSFRFIYRSATTTWYPAP